jgi:tetratricopeptide (TPR) repeat protein
MRRYVLLLFILTGSCLGNASEPSRLMDQANTLYKDGKFEDAIAKYEQVVASGMEAPELYYNLGNAYYRSQKLPNAILWYERAWRLDPSDDEISFNLDLARSKTVDKISALPEFFVTAWLRSLISSFSPNQWAVAGMASFFLCLILTLIYLFSARLWLKKFSFALACLILLVSIVSIFFSFRQKSIFESKNQAIIMAPVVSVKSSPAESGTDLFVLHEGTAVKVEDEVGEWLEVRIGDGNKGWMHAIDLERI